MNVYHDFMRKFNMMELNITLKIWEVVVELLLESHKKLDCFM